MEPASALETIKGKTNPEIHHYHRGSHPGAAWYIKTVLPPRLLLNPGPDSVIDFWEDLACANRSLVRLVPVAYDWDGLPIDGWQTIWLNERIDVIWDWSQDAGFTYRFVDFTDGLNDSGRRLMLAHGHVGDIDDIASFLMTYTNDKKSKEKRKRLRIITDDQEV